MARWVESTDDLLSFSQSIACSVKLSLGFNKSKFAFFKNCPNWIPAGPAPITQYLEKRRNITKNISYLPIKINLSIRTTPRTEIAVTVRLQVFVCHAFFYGFVHAHGEFWGWRKIWENFSGKPREARRNFGIRPVFDEILSENGVEMQGKCCQNLNFRV